MMNIGIIGAGNIGATLARKLVELNFKVSIANSRGPESLEGLAKEIGAKAGTVYDIAQNNDLVIITIPQKNIPDLPDNLFADLNEKVIVIDTCNYYPLLRDGIISDLESALASSLWVQEKVKRPVVKAFNSISYLSLGNGGLPEGAQNRIALPISGDRKEDLAEVETLLNQLGFDACNLGELKHSWKYEPGTPTYCMDFNLETVKIKLDNLGNVRTSELKENFISQRTAQEKRVLEYFSRAKE